MVFTPRWRRTKQISLCKSSSCEYSNVKHGTETTSLCLSIVELFLNDFRPHTIKVPNLEGRWGGEGGAETVDYVNTFGVLIYFYLFFFSFFLFTVNGDNLSNGSLISVPDPVVGDIFIPPPPAIAAPPPPGTFILPPPDFLGEMNGPALANLTPLEASTGEEEDFTLLRPPPMSPPKPPSICSTGSSSSIPRCSPPLDVVPDHPKFAPPQPPAEKLQRSVKSPPPKPIRMSSISNFDPPPQTPAPPPPVQTPTRSTFNPQNTAKLYHVPKTSFLGSFDNRDTKPKQTLVLEDSGSVTSTPLKVQTDGKAVTVASPPEPVSEDTRDQKGNKRQITPEPPHPVVVTTQTETNPAPPERPQLQTPPRRSPEPKMTNSLDINSPSNTEELRGSPTPICKFSPLIDRKLRNLKNNDSSAARDAPAASPLALLMAAKKREKDRSSHSLSRENSDKRGEQPSSGVLSASSLMDVPHSSSCSSLTSTDRNKDSLNSGQMTVQTQETSNRRSLVNDPGQTASPVQNSIKAAAPASAADLVGPKQNLTNRTPPKTQFTQPEETEEAVLPVLPPPPEFDDLEEFMEPPPSILPPDPPLKKPPPPPPNLPPPAPSFPNLTPTVIPKAPPPPIDIKPKPKVQIKPQMPPNQLPTPLSPKQATLLSILQKKMLEMDHRMVPVKEAESASDDWGSPLSDEEGKIPAIPKTPPLSKNYPVVNKAATLDMRELEGKMAKKNQEMFSTKAATR